MPFFLSSFLAPNIKLKLVKDNTEYFIFKINEKSELLLFKIANAVWDDL